MNLNHLKALVKVVQTGSFKEAARHLNVSQPAITQRIQALEEYLKTRLLSKEADGVQLTSHGRTVYEASIQILSQWERVEEEVWGTKVKGRLTIGASTIPSEYVLPPLLKLYRSIYPDVKLQLRISGTNEVIRWLRDRTVDIAITGEPMTTEGVVSFPLAEDQMRIIIPIDYDWPTTIEKLDMLAETDWIMREPDSDTRRTLESYLIKSGIDVHRLSISGQVESTEAVIAAVEAGLGISAVSALAANKAVRLGGVKMVEIPEFSISRKFYCSFMEDQRNQSVISTFVQFLHEKSAI
ncbi:selenium metabolism-associated LysR family transcriptional regulator [Ammoniphilus sp. YIM 78166]|uniref:selenium metabolism-associated LysR family transcriptional regulator n=1 Tax=Ammoniphilus sp. YIM 78166 TaxID=1644106 RepID=UPI00106F2CF8|nr:selenium metabolism-associated LysR family transcriptional regulator [Ammoniphilus sp. YIM 78166]